MDSSVKRIWACLLSMEQGSKELRKNAAKWESPAKSKHEIKDVCLFIPLELRGRLLEDYESKRRATWDHWTQRRIYFNIK